MRRPAAPAGAAPAPGTAAPAATGSAAARAVVELQPEDLSRLNTQTLIQTLPVSGNLKALNSVTIKARVAGELLSLQGREGDSVKAGQVLAKIDPVEYQRRLRQAEQQADAAKTQIDIALRQYDNNKALVDQGFISKTALEASEATLNGARATYNAAVAAADVARKTLDETVLLAPISGQIAARLAQPGERVAIDQKLLDIVDLSSLELEATLSPADAMDVRTGQQAQLTLEGREKTLYAQVQRINPNVQSNSRSVLVYLRLQNAPGLRQGLYGQGQLELASRQVTALPLETVRTDKPLPYVQLLLNGRVAHQTVTLGQRGTVAGGNQAQVWVEVKGVAEGAQVLSARTGSLREGMNLRIAAPAAQPAVQPAAVPAPAPAANKP
ncbi:MAG: efflux RND transporter periplasmic adaptor subunit [Limnohabitans sp.]|nr:efflux RND transporter periplasmic adaptor subunit [Limnohabitans sp.]